jgi:hypothetical protein
MNKKYYYAGTYYDTYEEFWQGFNNFQQAEMTEESLEYLVDIFCKHVKCNANMFLEKAKNSQISLFLRLSSFNLMESMVAFKKAGFIPTETMLNTVATLLNSCNQDSSSDSVATGSAETFDRRPLC